MIIDNRKRRAKQEFNEKPNPIIASGGRAARTSDLLNFARGVNAMYGVNPSFPVEFIEIFKILASTNPDVSQAVQKVTTLGNVGHYIDVEAASESAIDAALESLNDIAINVFDTRAGADGFVNQQFRQIMVTGALSQETVPDKSLKGLKSIYQVRTSSIRFDLVDGEYCPFQIQGNEKVFLNPNTFSYIPLFCEEDSPYGIPPMLAALRFILRQEKNWEKLDDYTELWGLIGYTHISTIFRQQFNEMSREYEERASRHFKAIAERYAEGRNKGIVVTDDGTDVDHKTVSKNIGQADTIIETVEQMIASGIDIDPAMLGRSYSTTETYATVSYQTLLGKVANIQRIIKRTNESSYNLHLLLQGIPGKCTMTFKPSPSLKAKEEAETEEIRQRMILERMDRGIIDEDMAAQELGYKKAASKARPGINSLSARFDGSSGEYVLVKPSIDLGKKKSSEDIENKKSLKIEEEYSNEFFDLYTVKVNETVEGIEIHIKDKEALDKIMAMAESKMSNELADEAAVIAKAKNSEAYVAACGIDWNDENWKVTDTRAIEWFKENDRFFFANQFKHYKDDLKTVVENELKGIERAYDPKVVKRLEKKMGDVFHHPQIQDYYELVIRNAVNRSRNYGRIAKYQRLNIAEIEIVAVMDEKTSEICKAMNGRRLKVEEMAEYVEKTIEAPLDELKEKFGWPSDSMAREFASMSTDAIMQKIGCKLPPYHGRCRTTTVVSMSTRVINNSGTELNTMREPATKGMNDKAKRAIKTKNAERWGEYKNLTVDEWSSKISAFTASQWDKENLENHWSKHKKDFDNYSNGVKLNNMNEYEAFSKKMLQDFNRCFIYKHRGLDRVMFLNTKNNCAVMVDARSSRIVSCYPLKSGQKKSYQNQFMELVNGKE